jgi:DNA helicase II / ATP-dependent DNA helicase PcrA
LCGRSLCFTLSLASLRILASARDAVKAASAEADQPEWRDALSVDGRDHGTAHKGQLVPPHEVAAERQRFSTIVREIDQRLAEVRAARATRAGELAGLRRDFWEDFKLQDDPIDAAAEAEQEHFVLSHKERQHDRAVREAALLARLRESPYFGRVDFAADDEPDLDAVYIGLCSFRADDGSQRVYDWRAPISSLYYDAVPGRATYEAPAGLVRGEMRRKRQFVVRDGRLDGVLDSDLTIGDSLLMESLSRHGDAAMRSIVSTIQAEQNRAIRDLAHRLVVVLGSAGSGKTSVALQRVAFLLYHYRDSLDADQVVLFSPNPLFSSFVSTVLPELGERNMRQVTFQEHLERRLGAEFRVEDPYDQLERMLTAAPSPALEARRAAIAFKASAAFPRAIQRYADGLARGGMAFRPLLVRGAVVLGTSELGEMFQATTARAPLAWRVQRMREALRRRLRTFAAHEEQAEWPEEELDLVDVETHHAIYEQLSGRDDARSGPDYYRREHALLTRAIVERHLAGARQWVEEMRFVDTAALYLRLLDDPGLFDGQGGPPTAWADAVAETRHRLGDGEVPYEDATPLLYLTELVRGTHTNTAVRHVLVDEAQDYSHCQLDFLRRVFPFARMTLLGDPNQAVHVGGAALLDLATVTGAYGGDATLLRLERSYRPTRQIVAFTRHLLPPGQEVAAFDRPGRKPRLSVAASRVHLEAATQAAVRQLREGGCQTVAVVTKTAAEASAVAAALPADLGGHLVTRQSLTLEAGVTVLPGYLAKGLEFDGVVVYDASRERYGAQADRSLLYAACTRAMHELWLVALKEPSSFLAAAPAHTYTLVP